MLFLAGCLAQTPTPQTAPGATETALQQMEKVTPVRELIPEESVEQSTESATSEAVLIAVPLAPAEESIEPLALTPLEMPACPEPKPCPVCPKTESVKKKLIVNDFDKLIIGELEEVYLPIHKIGLKARIDTGASTTSVHALDIVAFERDGKKWVRFDMPDRLGVRRTIKRPIERSVRIKRHGMESQERYVVKMRLNLSSVSKFVEVSLTDRTNYKYPVLIGRNYLTDGIIVDVSKRFTKKPVRTSK